MSDDGANSAQSPPPAADLELPVPDAAAPIADDPPKATTSTANAEPQQYVVRDCLPLRAKSGAKKKGSGEVDAGTRVIVLQINSLPSGASLAQIALVGTSDPLGWVVMHAKDGFANLREVTAETSPAAMRPKIARNRARRATVYEALLSLAPVMTPKSKEEEQARAQVETSEAWIGAVRRCVLLSGLGEAELSFVLQATRSMETTEGQVIIQQGDSIAQGMFYLIASGIYSVRTETVREGHTVTRRLREYGPQENFGASELLCNDTNGLRAYSVVTVKPGMVWAIPKRIVDMKLRVPPSAASDLLSFCRNVKLFNNLSTERLLQLCRGAVETVLQPQDQLVEQGDPARSIFAIQSGSLVTSQADNNFSVTRSTPFVLGESAFSASDEVRVRGSSLHAGKGGATVISWAVAAIETLVGFRLHAASYALINRQILQKVQIAGRAFAEGLGEQQMDDIIELMEEQTVLTNELVLPDKEIDASLYIIRSGEALVTWDGQPPTEAPILRRGDCFGEQAVSNMTLNVSRSPAAGRDARRKAPPRRTRVVTSPLHPALTCMVLTENVVNELSTRDWFPDWWDKFVEHVLSTAAPGVDAVAVARLRESGDASKLAALTGSANKPKTQEGAPRKSARPKSPKKSA